MKMKSYRLLLALLAVWSELYAGLLVAAENNAAIEKRLADTVRYLASDELEGRGVGTKGIDLAAEYIGSQFSKLGLNTALYDGEAFQKFRITTSVEMGPKEKNRLVLVGPPEKQEGPPQQIELELGKDFNTLAIGGSRKFDLPLVFVGYGITDTAHHYDDYKDVDVKGKAVLILRKEPQQNDPHSVFEGTSNSRHAFFSRKVSNAYEHGAAAVILVNDDYGNRQQTTASQNDFQELVTKLTEKILQFKQVETPSAKKTTEHLTETQELAGQIKDKSHSMAGKADKIVEFRGAGDSSGHRSLPVFFCTRAAMDRAVRSVAKTDLAALERLIDKGPKPHSRPLAPWRVTGEAHVVSKQVDVKNVLAVLDGVGPLADETVVVGAHYDHLGMGGSGALAPWTVAVHNGADDNASGVAALLEVARQLASRKEKLPRRVVFIAFTGEERGLLGSAHYVKQPKYPLQSTLAMLNMDMVGRLRDEKLIVHGTGTAAKFDALIDRLNKKHGFQITKQPSGYGPSDHTSFYAQQIPVFHFFTGTHRDYHRPSDDFVKINVSGIRRVGVLITDLVVSIATAPQRPEYREMKRPPSQRGGSRPYFGSIPDFASNVEGYALMGVAKGGPAERGGLKKGDVIIQFGQSKIGGLEDFDSALRKYKAGQKVTVVVKRGDKTLSLSVKLAPPR